MVIIQNDYGKCVVVGISHIRSGQRKSPFFFEYQIEVMIEKMKITPIYKHLINLPALYWIYDTVINIISDNNSENVLFYKNKM